MIRLFVLLLSFFISISCSYSQDQKYPNRVPLTDWFFKAASSGSASRIYITPQDGPTFSNSQTLSSGQVALPGSIFPVDLTKKEIILSGNWALGITFNTLVGSAGPVNNFRFTNADNTVTIGTATNANHAFQSLNDCNYLEVSGRKYSEPIILKAGSGQSGFVWYPLSGAGSVIRIRNTLGDAIKYADLLASVGASGKKYQKIIYTNNRIKGNVLDGEGIYIGNVSTATQTDLAVVTNFAVMDKGREAIQVKWANSFKIYGFTAVNVGQIPASDPNHNGQNHGLQIEASNGFYKDGIVYNSPRPINFFSHGDTIKNVSFYYSEERGYIGDALDAFPGDPRLTGGPIVFIDCDFTYIGPGTIDYFTEIAERTANIEWKNCKFSSNIQALYYDHRSPGHTNSIIGTFTTNGNSIVDVPIPTFKSTDVYSEDFLKLTSAYHYNLGRGSLTPRAGNKEVLDATEIAGISVNYNTAFASVPLPATGTFLTSDGNEVTLAITWVQGSYSATTPGAVTVLGTPTVTAGMRNNYAVKASVVVTVGAAPTPDKHVLVDLTTTSSPTLTPTGNWNHAEYVSFAIGAVLLKDGANNTLLHLINTEGTDTGYGVTIPIGSNFSAEAIGETSSSGAIYPVAVNTSVWNNVGTTGQVRALQFTGLNNSFTYTVKLLGSVDNGVGAGSHTCDLQVTGATSPSYVTGINVSGNVSTTTNFSVAPSSGIITVNTRRTSTGSCALAAIELVYTP